MEIFSGKNGSAILLMLPQEFSSRVMEWGEKNVNDDCLSMLPNKGRDKSPHITLATGIIDEAPEKAFKLLEKNGPIKVSLGNVDCFRKHEKGYDVIKINVDSESLHKLNQEILQGVEVNNPVNSFKPHITIAYVKPFSCEGLIGNTDFSGEDLIIDSYVLSDREKGGKVVHLRNNEPLKESLDYSIQDISKFLNKNILNIQAMSSRDLGRIVISMNSSKKTV